MNRKSALAHLRQICSLEIDFRMAVPAVLAALKGCVPHRAGMFFWASRSGGVSAAYADEPGLHGVAGRFAADYAPLAWPGARWPGFGELLQRSEGCVVDPSDRPASTASQVFRDLFEPLGLTRLLASPVVSSSGIGGLVVLLRGACEPPFGRAEEGLLAGLSPRIGFALDRRPGVVEFVDDDDPSGLLLLCADGALSHACARGRQLLHLATCPERLFCGRLHDEEQDLLNKFSRLAAAIRPLDGSARSVCVENDWGQFRFRVSTPVNAYGHRELIAIQVRRLSPAAVKMALGVGSLELSPRLREVAVLLGCRMGNSAVADRLGLRPNTVASMIKEIYLRCGVNSRHSLRELLLRTDPLAGVAEGV